MKTAISFDTSNHSHDPQLGYNPDCAKCKKLVEEVSESLKILLVLYVSPRFENTCRQLDRAIGHLRKAQIAFDSVTDQINAPEWDNLCDAPRAIMLETKALRDRYPRRSRNFKRPAIEFVMACYFDVFRQLPDYSSRTDGYEKQPNSPSTRFVKAVWELGEKKAIADLKIELDIFSSATSRRLKLPTLSSDSYKTMRTILMGWKGRAPMPQDIFPYDGDISSWSGERKNGEA